MRKAAVTLAILLAAGLGVAGCSSSTSGTATTTQPTSSSAASEPDAAAVEKAFTAYYQALLARDYAKACSYNAPETNKALLDNVRSRNIPANTCDEALQKIYATPGTAEAADKIVSSSKIEDIKVTGENATITWSAEQDGKRQNITNSLRKIDGDWKLVDVD